MASLDAIPRSVSPCPACGVPPGPGWGQLDRPCAFPEGWADTATGRCLACGESHDQAYRPCATSDDAGKP